MRGLPDVDPDGLLLIPEVPLTPTELQSSESTEQFEWESYLDR